MGEEVILMSARVVRGGLFVLGVFGVWRNAVLLWDAGGCCPLSVSVESAIDDFLAVISERGDKAECTPVVLGALGKTRSVLSPGASGRLRDDVFAAGPPGGEVEVVRVVSLPPVAAVIARIDGMVAFRRGDMPGDLGVFLADRRGSAPRNRASAEGCEACFIARIEGATL